MKKSRSPADDDAMSLDFQQMNDADEPFTAMKFEVVAVDVSDSGEDARLDIYIMVGGSLTKVADLDGSGNLRLLGNITAETATITADTTPFS